MLKLLNAQQTKQADKHTIENEPISSIELMERASSAFVKFFIERYPNKGQRISVYCGKGNNGGDGLAIARLLVNEKYNSVNVFITDFTDNNSLDFNRNLELLQELDISIFYLKLASELEFQQSDIIIDALFGIGLNRPLDGEWAKLIKKINHFPGIKVSVDVPSGMPAEGKLQDDNIFKADWVITFQRPKLNFLLPLSAPYIKEWKVINIGLDENFIESISSPFYWFWKKDISKYIRVKNTFDHKGTNGHNLIIAGAENTMGAALLCAEASLRSGSGLITASIPQSGITSLNSRLPEIMYLSREEIANINLDKYQSICIGPGLGQDKAAKEILETVIQNYRKPIVFDADSLNILAEDQNLLKSVPPHSVLTPHLKEFDRLFGEHLGCWERIETAFERAKELQIFIVLKNRYTMIFSPDGLCYFNSSGSPAMATGGMGDVLTGMIGSYIAQGYAIDKAVLLGVFIHAYTGEHLSQNMYTIPPSKLLKLIPSIMKELKP